MVFFWRRNTSRLWGLNTPLYIWISDGTVSGGFPKWKYPCRRAPCSFDNLTSLERKEPGRAVKCRFLHKDNVARRTPLLCLPYRFFAERRTAPVYYRSLLDAVYFQIFAEAFTQWENSGNHVAEGVPGAPRPKGIWRRTWIVDRKAFGAGSFRKFITPSPASGRFIRRMCSLP